MSKENNTGNCHKVYECDWIESGNLGRKHASRDGGECDIRTRKQSTEESSFNNDRGGLLSHPKAGTQQLGRLGS